MNIETITTSDTITQFMTKCNNNFAEIVRNGGGPEGRAGQDGSVGPKGARGNKIWVNDADIDESNPDYNSELLDDYDDGDLVFFTDTNTLGNVKITESTINGITLYTKTFENATSLKGEQGIQGTQGTSANEQFDVKKYSGTSTSKYISGTEETSSALVLGKNFGSLIIPYLPSNVDNGFTPTNPLCINCDNLSSGYPDEGGNGISFALKSDELAAIKIDRSKKFVIASELPELSISSGTTISIGKSDTNGVKNLNLYGKSILLNSYDSSNGIVIDETYGINVTGKSDFNGNAVFENSINVKDTASINTLSVVDESTLNGTVYTKNIENISNKALSISSDKQLSITGTSYSDSVYIQSNNYVNIGNAVYTKNGNLCKNPEYPTTDAIRSSCEMEASVCGKTFVYLGTPLYTLSLLPVYAEVPKHWIRWNRSIIVSAQTPDIIPTENSNKYINVGTYKTKKYAEVKDINFLSLALANTLEFNLDEDSDSDSDSDNSSSNSGFVYNAATRTISVTTSSTLATGTTKMTKKQTSFLNDITTGKTTTNSLTTTSETLEELPITNTTNSDVTTETVQAASTISGVVESLEDYKLKTIVANFTRNMLFSGYTGIRTLPANAKVTDEDLIFEAIKEMTPTFNTGTILKSTTTTNTGLLRRNYTISIAPPTAPDGFNWMFKYE